jgi:type I restriction enzyme S subunit
MPNPSNEILQKFEKTLEYSFKKTTATTKENHQLTQLRDWLLPMLMNGQVTVSNQAKPAQ